MFRPNLKKVPDDFAGCFPVLAEAATIPVDLSERLQKMPRFQNLLVHMYWRVDYRILYDQIQNEMDDLRLFAGAIAALL